MANIRVTGIDEMLRRLHQIGSQATKIENEALRAGAEVLKRTMEKNAPGPSQKRRLHLIRNIQMSRVKYKKGEKVIEVGPGKDAFYAHFLEFGTTKMAARPFVEPSVYEAAEAVVGRITAVLRRGLRL